MKLAYALAFTATLLSTTMPAGTMAQVTSDVPVVVPGAVSNSAQISNTPRPKSPTYVIIPALPSVSVLAYRAMHGSPVQGANPACTGTSADADVCKGWQ